MLRVADIARDLSISYVYRDVMGDSASMLFEIDVSGERDRDICIFRMRSVVGPLCAIFLSPRGGIRLRVFNYLHYPGGSLYPSPLLFPSSRTLYPGIYPGVVYPPYSTTDTEVFSNTSGVVECEVEANSFDTIEGEVSLYARRGNVGMQENSISEGGFNWLGRPISGVDIGCVSARQTKYDIRYPSFSLLGEVQSGEWYEISDYSGFALDPLDGGILFQGANDVGDPLTYSEYTDIRNLTRYDYARADGVLVSPPRGVIWTLNNEEGF